MTTILKEVAGSARTALGSTNSDNVNQLGNKITTDIKGQPVIWVFRGDFMNRNLCFALAEGIGVFIGFIVNAAFDIADGLVFKLTHFLLMLFLLTIPSNLTKRPT
jgi:hypothetical protein